MEKNVKRQLSHNLFERQTTHDFGFNFVSQSLLNFEYSVIATDNLFKVTNKAIFDIFSDGDSNRKRCFIIIDKNVNKLYGQQIRNYFKHYDIDFSCFELSVCEERKNMDFVYKIIQELIDFKLSRRSEPIFAIGGGVLMDIASLAASLHRRGTPYIKIPTTLMGLIDAGIGVKTGVNFLGHKNRIGSYHAPSAVFLDKNFLRTLDDRHISNGLAEIIKMALVKDKTLFALLEKSADTIIFDRLIGKPIYDAIIKKSVCGMLEELASNLWEDKLERSMDYGHSFSLGIEMHALPELLHGEAVAIEIAFSILLSELRDMITSKERQLIFRLMSILKLPLTHQICTVDFLYTSLQDITAHRDGLQRVPLIKGIGNVKFVDNISYEEIEAVTKNIKIISLDHS